MILSMTGFSSKTLLLTIGKSNEKINLTMTLKSLNSRYFELNCKLPFALTQIETSLITLLKSKLYRGNVYLTVHVENQSALITQVEPSMNIVSNYFNAIEKIKKSFPLQGNFTVSDIINLPNIFETYEEKLDKFTVDKIIENIDSLADALIKMRIQEGKALEIDFDNRIKTVTQYINKLEPRAKKVIATKKEKLTKEIQKAIEDHNEITTDLQSLAIYNQLNKLDIHEEIVRFKSHLDNLKKIIKSTKHEKGKKIDFTLQELFREINTITSKCADSEISSIAIDIKVELEKAREQAQNVV